MKLLNIFKNNVAEHVLLKPHAIQRPLKKAVEKHRIFCSSLLAEKQTILKI
jgi:hypothetical protein